MILVALTSAGALIGAAAGWCSPSRRPSCCVGLLDRDARRRRSPSSSRRRRMPPVTTPPRLVLVLSENWTLVVAARPRRARADRRRGRGGRHRHGDAVRARRDGPVAGADGIMGNPRDYAAPGNQDPATPWPDSIVLASAIAAATDPDPDRAGRGDRAAAPPAAARQAAGDARPARRGPPVVQPTVAGTRTSTGRSACRSASAARSSTSSSRRCGRAWRDTPAPFHGEHFDFDDVYLEPKAYRPEGPRMWFGGMPLHEPVLRRLVRYGHGFHPFGTPTPEELARAARRRWPRPAATPPSSR